jgi:hypothetical protein
MSTLFQFFAAYFHQDWMVDANEPHEVIEKYIEWESPETVRETLNELHQLIAEERSDSDLRRILLNDLGCYNDPYLSGKTAIEWLRDIAEQLTKSLESDHQS